MCWKVSFLIHCHCSTKTSNTMTLSNQPSSAHRNKNSIIESKLCRSPFFLPAVVWMISWARERQQQCYGYTQRPACTRHQVSPPMFGLDNYPRRNLCRSSSCLPATAITANISCVENAWSDPHSYLWSYTRHTLLLHSQYMNTGPRCGLDRQQIRLRYLLCLMWD